MCRHLLYLGPPASLASLLFEPPHGLTHQAWAPQHAQDGNTVNVDGFGVGWYGDSGAVRYRRNAPIWSDDFLRTSATVITSQGILAAIRAASAGMPYGEAACAPFAADGWFFSHNGFVAGWPDSIAKLAERLPVTELLTLDAPTDSAVLWALLRHRLRAGEEPDTAVASIVAEVTAAAPGSRLNLLLTDGSTGYATRAGHSLFLRRRSGGVVIASEPLDSDPDWTSIPEDTVVVADPTGYTLEEL